MAAIEATAAAEPGVAFDASRYRPAGSPFPQIIQGGDYATIRAIEALESALPAGDTHDLSCAEVLNRIALPTRAGSSVTISRHHFGSEASIVLFRTLKRVSDDLGATRPCEGVRHAHFRTRAYQRRTILEFKFGENIVALEADSNGATDSERLYLLDVVNPGDSMFYAR